MARRGGGRLSRVIQVTLVLGVASLGCQASMSNRLFMGEADEAVDQAYDRHEAGQQRSSVVRAAYYDSNPDQAAGAKTNPEKLPSPRSLQAPAVTSAAGVAGMDGLIAQGALAGPDGPVDPQLPLPREKSMSYLPPYVIEPPDVLFIQAIRMIPKPPYRIKPLDVLNVVIPLAELGQNALTGSLTVTPEGTIDLGPPYGTVPVTGLTLKQAANAVRQRLSSYIKNPQVRVSLQSLMSVSQTQGEHWVCQDGTITLGTYGCVYVAGLTLPQAKCAIEKHLSRYLLNPEVAVSIAAYNSKYYYVIADGAGFGESVFRFPITGKETVLDAIGNIRGLPPMASKRVWVARPSPCNHGCYQILPVDWDVIVRAGDTCTNYQIFPGDRVYIKASRLICLNNYLIKLLAPVEQIFGVTLLGAATVYTLKAASHNNFGNNGTTGVLVP
jgi:polysaccharide export outer membrane protein